MPAIYMASPISSLANPITPKSRGIKTMFMKRIAVMAAVAMALSLVTFESAAGPWKKFEDTLTQVESAKDIVIAECVAEIRPGPRTGIAPCEAKVVAVIKGDRKVGKLPLL